MTSRAFKNIYALLHIKLQFPTKHDPRHGLYSPKSFFFGRQKYPGECTSWQSVLACIVKITHRYLPASKCEQS